MGELNILNNFYVLSNFEMSDALSSQYIKKMVRLKRSHKVHNVYVSYKLVILFSHINIQSIAAIYYIYKYLFHHPFLYSVTKRTMMDEISYKWFNKSDLTRILLKYSAV